MRWRRVSTKRPIGCTFSIPDELSVIGFDDTPMASRLTPALTTIRLPIREIGRLAAAMLIAPKGSEQSEGEHRPSA